MREDTKKFFYRSVSVREGNVFSIHEKTMNKAGLDTPMYPIEEGKGHYQGYEHSSSSKFPDDPKYAFNYLKLRTEYIGCFEDDPIDMCELRYMNCISLQILGVLHVQNIQHLRYLPAHVLKEEQYLVESIKTILENTENSNNISVIHLEQLELERIPHEFAKWTNVELSNCYELYTKQKEINIGLFQRYPQFFELTLDIKPILKLKPDLLRTGKYPITFPKEYFINELRKLKYGGDTSTVSATQMEDTECIVVSDNEEKI